MNFDIISFVIGFIACMACGIIVAYIAFQMTGSNNDRPYNPNKSKSHGFPVYENPPKPPLKKPKR